MAEVTFWCDSGANIHSCNTETVDTVGDLGLDGGEWEKLTDDERHQHVRDWANNYIEMGWEAI